MSYIDINGTQTWYTEAGEGQPLILLHGGGVGSFWWERPGIVEVLSGHFRVYCMDRRAHGFTHDPGGPITFDAMAGDTIAFVEASCPEQLVPRFPSKPSICKLTESPPLRSSTAAQQLIAEGPVVTDERKE